MDKVDISHLSVSELDELVIRVKDLAKKKRDDDLKSLVTEFLQKSKDLNVSESDLIHEIKSRESKPEDKQKKKTNVVVKENPWVKGARYCDPAAVGNVWVGGTKGRKPPWLLALTPDSLTLEELKAVYSKLQNS